jgi:hypothetical protein
MSQQALIQRIRAEYLEMLDCVCPSRRRGVSAVSILHFASQH